MKVKSFYDNKLLFSALTLLCLGLVMVASSSIPIAEGKQVNAFYYTYHQGVYIFLGLMVSIVATYIPIKVWAKLGASLLFISFILLTILLIPGISRRINGSVRWLFIGPISIQVSEIAKFAVIVYLSGYLVRRQQEVRIKMFGFIKPLLVLAMMGVLLLLEPDFGAAVVISATSLGMMFLSGVPFKRFMVLLLLVAAAMGGLAISSPYRFERITSFLNPWADQYNTGYQLTQALIGIGRGGWFGMGLGNSIQKLLYLPEPHTDFLFAVIVEELGIVGAIGVLFLFCVLVNRAFILGRLANAQGKLFACYLAYGLGLGIAFQTIINVGVNLGVLPTKGLTLPLMSYGGSSIIIAMLTIGILFRIDFETRFMINR
ncbi:MAG: ftsW [Francisellaceae bacterium]|nr:ftsW [Francisellaceae bacterium]